MKIGHSASYECQGRNKRLLLPNTLSGSSQNFVLWVQHLVRLSLHAISSRPRQLCLQKQMKRIVWPSIPFAQSRKSWILFDAADKSTFIATLQPSLQDQVDPTLRTPHDMDRHYWDMLRYFVLSLPWCYNRKGVFSLACLALGALVSSKGHFRNKDLWDKDKTHPHSTGSAYMAEATQPLPNSISSATHLNAPEYQLSFIIASTSAGSSLSMLACGPIKLQSTFLMFPLTTSRGP